MNQINQSDKTFSIYSIFLVWLVPWCEQWTILFHFFLVLRGYSWGLNTEQTRIHKRCLSWTKMNNNAWRKQQPYFCVAIFYRYSFHSHHCTIFYTVQPGPLAVNSLLLQFHFGALKIRIRLLFMKKFNFFFAIASFPFWEDSVACQPTSQPTSQPASLYCGRMEHVE